jgi:hypothetical protein
MTTATVPAVRAPEWAAPAVPLPIRSHDDYLAVADALKTVKAYEKQVEDTIGPHIQRAHATWKGLTEQRRQALEVAKQWEGECKTALAEWDTEQERLQREEQRRLEEEARRQEEARRLEEAAALEAEGIAEGDEGKITEANELIAAPVETPVVSVPKATPQVQGVSFRESWDARVTDLHQLVRHVAQHPDLVTLLQPNATALRQMARSLKGNLRLPGVQAYAQKVVAAR